MDELWQLYDEQGCALEGEGATKDDTFSKGLLHGASHVWIWRSTQDGNIEILVQKRAADKRTWPNRYDISAAGHIDLGEDPLTTALRETVEEIGLTADKKQLRCFGVFRAYLITDNGSRENEFQWLYLLELSEDTPLTLQTSELESVEWVSLDTFKTSFSSSQFVPHGEAYYNSVVAAVELANK
ncbi:MAG TPA: NUDIX domain-containing protein [Candidatus Saccharimonadales bacterium]|jgi:isopentenyldiphosphate isomerase